MSSNPTVVPGSNRETSATSGTFAHSISVSFCGSFSALLGKPLKFLPFFMFYVICWCSSWAKWLVGDGFGGVVLSAQSSAPSQALRIAVLFSCSLARLSRLFFYNVSSGGFDFEERYRETWHPEIPCFYTTVNIWIPERWSEKLKASRQLYLTSVILQNCSSLDRSAVLNCSTLPAGLWRNSLKVKSLASLTCLFDAEHQLVQLVLHGFRCPFERYSPAHPSSRICCSAQCRRPL